MSVMSVKWSGSEDGPSEPLIDLFEERKNVFLESLERIITFTGSDRFIKQMFVDDNSSLYVPNRVCEIVYHVLRDDREKFVKMLMERIEAFEACFGTSRTRQIEEIGNRLIEMSSHQSLVEAEQRNSIRILKEQLRALQAELEGVYSPTEETLSQMRDELVDMREMAAALVDLVQRMTDEMVSVKQRASESVKSLVERFEKVSAENERLKEQMETNSGERESKDRMKKKLEKATSLIRDKDETIARLRIELSEAQDGEGGSAARKLEKAKRVIQANDDEISELKDEIAMLKAQLEHGPAQLEHARQKLAKAKEILQQKNSEIEELKDSADVSDQLRRNLETAMWALKEKSDRIKEL